MTTIAKLVVELDSTGMTAGLRQTTAGLMDFARAGASVAQITQLTGVTVATAKDAVARFGGQANLSAGELRGLAAAQREMSVAGITVNNTVKATTQGMGTLRSSLASSVTAMSGLPPQLTMIASQLGVMGAGFAPVLAGLAAVGVGLAIWKLWHAEADKAIKVQEAAFKSLKDFNAEARQGFGGKLALDLENATAGMKRLTEAARAERAGTQGVFEAFRVAFGGKSAQDQLIEQTKSIGTAQAELASKFGQTTGAMLLQVQRQHELNGAFGQSSLAADLINNKFDYFNALLEHSHGFTKAEQTALDALSKTMRAQADAAARLKPATVDLTSVKALITAEGQLAAVQQVNTPIGIKLTQQLVQEHAKLVEQLKAVETQNPFSAMAIELRGMVKSVDDMVTAIAKVRKDAEQLAKILVTPIPGVATPIRPGAPAVTPAPAPVLNAPKLDVSKLQGVFDVLDGVGTSLGAAFGPVAILVQAMQPALQILADLFDKLLAPLTAVAEVIVQGLLPQFKLLFPIIKLFGEIVAIVDIVVGKVVAAFAQVVGGAIKAIGHFIGQIPFMGGLGKSIENFGDSIIGFSNGVKDNVSQMEQTLRDLQAMQFGDTAVAVTKLGDAANQVAGVLNGPQGFKYEWTKYMASAATPLTPPSIGMGGSTKSAEGQSGSTSAGVVVNGDVYIDAKSLSSGKLFELVKAEAQKVSLAKFGTTTRAAEALA